MVADDAYQLERENLNAVRNIDHPNLIKVVAAFKQSDINYLIFNWADGGNLRQYCNDNDPWESYSDSVYSPQHAQSAVKWALQQMTGIAGALDRLHHYGTNSNISHRDLKPENIVRFKHPYVDRGVFQIADMGLGKKRRDVTPMIRTGTGEQTGTDRYLAPELTQVTRPLSRADDMWAIGCTFLEFIIWLLYGRNAFVKFYTSWHENEGFYVFTTAARKVVLRAEVRSWIDYVYKQDLQSKDSPCTSQAIKDILDFILDKLLIATPLGAYSIPEESAETSAAEQRPAAQRSTESLEEQPGPEAPAIFVDSADNLTEDIGPESVGSDHRATSRELCKKLEAICKKFERDDTQASEYILNNKPRGDPLRGIGQMPRTANARLSPNLARR
jgi:serine/threonine protein kinase